MEKKKKEKPKPMKVFQAVWLSCGSSAAQQTQIGCIGHQKILIKETGHTQRCPEW